MIADRRDFKSQRLSESIRTGFEIDQSNKNMILKW
jgi:hypothetical protein